MMQFQRVDSDRIEVAVDAPEKYLQSSVFSVCSCSRRQPTGRQKVTVADSHLVGATRRSAHFYAARRRRWIAYPFRATGSLLLAFRNKVPVWDCLCNKVPVWDCLWGLSLAPPRAVAVPARCGGRVEALERADRDPRTPEYWSRTSSSQWSGWLTQRVKTLYGSFSLIRYVDDPAQRKKAEENFLYFMA